MSQINCALENFDNGFAPDKMFDSHKERGIEVLQFDGDFMKSRKAVST